LLDYSHSQLVIKNQKLLNLLTQVEETIVEETIVEETEAPVEGETTEEVAPVE